MAITHNVTGMILHKPKVQKTLYSQCIDLLYTMYQIWAIWQPINLEYDHVPWWFAELGQVTPQRKAGRMLDGGTNMQYALTTNLGTICLSICSHRQCV